MKQLTSFFWLLISIALVSLTFWGFSKFVPWYPTINNFIFYFLSFWFVFVAYRMFTSMLNSIKPLIEVVKVIGYTTFNIFRIVIMIILTIVCLVYLGQVILINKDLYEDWKLIGLISFCIFIVQCSLTFINQTLSPLDN